MQDWRRRRRSGNGRAWAPGSRGRHARGGAAGMVGRRPPARSALSPPPRTQPTTCSLPAHLAATPRVAAGRPANELVGPRGPRPLAHPCPLPTVAGRGATPGRSEADADAETTAAAADSAAAVPAIATAIVAAVAAVAAALRRPPRRPRRPRLPRRPQRRPALTTAATVATAVPARPPSPPPPPPSPP